jgi:hypothetical protein
MTAIAAVLGVQYVFHYGFFPRYFDLAWDEEVQLHDGRIVMLHIARTFERSGFHLERWGGAYRKTSFSFDAGPPIGRVEQELQRGEVFLLENVRGVWYVGMSAEAGKPIRNVSTDPLDVHVYVLNGNDRATRLASYKDIPEVIQRENILPMTPGIDGTKHFNGTVLTIGRKTSHWGMFPTAAGDPFPKIRRSDFGRGD